MAQKLLLADDSVTIQRVIELTFADEDIKVVAVSDGDEAIARIDADPPDIVLADVGMPGRDGYEVAAHVKASPQLAHIPVVLLTGAFEPVDQQRAAQVGSDGVLAKPFEPQLVITRVKELLERGPQRASQPVGRAAAPEPPAPVPAPPVEPQPAAVAGAAAGKEGHLDDYFDRLDVAFQTLSTAKPAGGTAAAPRPPAPDIDWFGAGQRQPAPDLPLSYASPQPSAGAAVPSGVGASGPMPSVPAAAVPTLADAFAAILASEQADPSAAHPTWPATAPEISESLVEEVTRRVLDRMSDRIVRETVTGLVSTITERLVREEIERIKASIK